jgi:PPK2 family polyphosphate:nucleotide phosphotransferase
MNYSKKFRVEPGIRVKLNKIDPGFTGKHKNKAAAEAKLEQYTQKLRELQYLLYAEGKRSLLICLQAMDAAGKDGTINHVMWAMNPQGTRVRGFKNPSREEAAHDFVWRVHQYAPAKGEVVIFNRSHYEDVLVVRVHNLVPRDIWSKRYELINDFEQSLAENGTHIIKFFLHISADEQLRRFKQRIDDPARHWKISESDYQERPFWKDYQEAYEVALSKTSTRHAPWFVIPSNHNWFRNLAVSQILVEALESLGMKFPAPSVDIKEIRRRYHAAAGTEQKQ